MDFLKKAAESALSNDDKNENKTQENKNESSNSVVGGLLGKVNNALGGGEKGEQKEDLLDKAVDLFQEKVLKEGAQNNESAAEQAKDKMVADAVRSGYKTVTGKEFPNV